MKKKKIKVLRESYNSKHIFTLDFTQLAVYYRKEEELTSLR